MKKSVFYLITILFALIIFLLLINRRYVLFRANSYKVYNEKKEVLPIYLSNRENNKDGNDTVIRELLLYIDKGINMRHLAYNHEVLTIHIDNPKLLEAVGGRESFIKIGDFTLLQTRANTGDDFLDLYNNGMVYNNKEEEPIQFFIAEGNTYKFNTFGGLKAYGDTIIVEKLDGPIEKEGRYIAVE